MAVLRRLKEPSSENLGLLTSYRGGPEVARNDPVERTKGRSEIGCFGNRQ
jgi:hypothetical protein